MQFNDLVFFSSKDGSFKIQRMKDFIHTKFIGQF